MSILRRMRDMTVATLNDKLEHSEDPVHLIDQYLAAQREQIQQAEKLYQQCSIHTQSLHNQCVNAEQWKNKREQQAILALKAGEVEVARLALEEKIQQEEKYVQYRNLFEQSSQSNLELELQIQLLKTDYDQVAAKRSYYQARLESVRLQQRMNERMNGMGNTSTPRMFERLEERVSDLEWDAKSLRDVRQMGQEAIYRVGTTVHHTLEQELNKLKKKLESEGWAKT